MARIKFDVVPQKAQALKPLCPDHSRTSTDELRTIADGKHLDLVFNRQLAVRRGTRDNLLVQTPVGSYARGWIESQQFVSVQFRLVPVISATHELTRVVLHQQVMSVLMLCVGTESPREAE